MEGVDLSQLCFGNRVLCFWAVLINLACYAQNYEWKVIEHREVHDACTVHTAISQKASVGLKWHLSVKNSSL